MPRSMRGLLNNILVIRDSFEDIVFKQRYREANSVVDYLEKASAAKDMEGVWMV